MNMPATLLFAILCTLTSVTIKAQPADERRPPREDRPGWAKEKPASPVQRYMQELREQDPGEFKRLQAMRNEDPDAFREHMRNTMDARFMNELQLKRPGIHRALSDLSGEDRAWLLRKLGDRPAAWSASTAEGSHERRGMKNGQARTRQLIEDYHREVDPAKKEEIQATLRDILSSEYDTRIRMRAEQLAHMESKVEELRSMLEAGKQDKQGFIDRKLSGWLDDSTTQR